jgi:hypothetical protein
MEGTNRMMHHKTHVLFVNTEPKCYHDMALVPGNSKTSAIEHTNRSAHDFDFPRAPKVVQFLLRIIGDLRMVHTRLNSTLALSIQVSRDTLRVLYKNINNK